MIDLSPKDNFYPLKENSYSALKTVILPLIGFMLLMIVISLLLFNQISNSQQSMLKWVNICIIIVSFLLFIPGIFSLILTIGLIIVLSKSKKPLHSRLRIIRDFVDKTSRLLTSTTALILKPVFFLESAIAFLHRPKNKYLFSGGADEYKKR